MHTSKQLNFKSAKSQVGVESSDDTYLKHIHAKLFRNKKFLTSEVNHVLGYMKVPFPTAEAWNLPASLSYQITMLAAASVAL